MNVQQHLPAENQIASSRIAESPRALKPGQMIQGRIMKLYPGQKALIQLGSQKTVARLEASLTIGSNYYFRVKSSDDVVHLQVIGEKDSGNVTDLLQQLGLKESNANAALLRSLLKERIPFTKDELQRAFQILDGGGRNSYQAQQTIKHMISTELPMTNAVYQALAAFESAGISEQIAPLLLQLRQNPDQTGLQQQLAYRLTQLIEAESSHLSAGQSAKDISQHIKQTVQSIGLNYENQLAANNFHEPQNTVKSMLLQLIQQSDGTMNERSQQLLNYLNGMQIHSVHDTNSAIQANLLVPGRKLGLPEDLQLSFSSNKTNDGKISADSCRILFYLELSHLNETIVDMTIQKRAVSLTIFNEQRYLQEQSAALKPMLKEGLSSLGYQLSTLSFKPLSEKNQSISAEHQTTHEGVDYRV